MANRIDLVCNKCGETITVSEDRITVVPDREYGGLVAMHGWEELRCPFHTGSYWLRPADPEPILVHYAKVRLASRLERDVSIKIPFSPADDDLCGRIIDVGFDAEAELDDLIANAPAEALEAAS